MTKKLSIAGLVVAAAASSTFAFGAAPAQAACLTSNASTNCSTFSPTSESSAEDFGYTDSVWVANRILTEIKFYSNNFTAGMPITLTDIAYSFNGTTWLTTGLSSTSYSVSATNSGAAANLLTANQDNGAAIGSTFRLRFKIPTSLGLAPLDESASITSRVTNRKNGSPADFQSQERSHAANEVSTAATPGPLPIFGAGLAFGFTRKVRKRIALSA